MRKELDKQPLFIFDELIAPFDPENYYLALDAGYDYARRTIPACADHHRLAVNHFYLLMTVEEIDDCYAAFYEYINAMLMYYVYRGQQLAVDCFCGRIGDFTQFDDLCERIDRDCITFLKSECAKGLHALALAGVARATILSGALLHEEYRQYYTSARLYARHLCVLAGYEQQITAMCSCFQGFRMGDYVCAIRDALCVPPRGCRNSIIAQDIFSLLALQPDRCCDTPINEDGGWAL